MGSDKLARYDLRINSAGRFESYRDGVWTPPAVFHDYDLLVFTAGMGSCLINGQLHTVSPHDILLMRRGDTMEKPVSAGRISNMLVHFDFLDAHGEPTDPPEALLPPRIASNANFLVLTHLTEAIEDLNRSGQRHAATIVLKAILQLLARTTEAVPNQFSVVHRSRLFEELAKRIMEDPAPRRSVEDLAAEVGMSAVQFTRVFAKETGYTPGSFMVLARVERARLLLTSTSETIGEIADALGYGDLYYFTRQFTEKTGTSPVAFRKQQDRKDKPKAKSS